MNKKILLLTKDALCKAYLPIYGNSIWKTPNIDELAQNGTVFTRHYTAAPCTSMAYYSMFTGQYNHQSSMKAYRILSADQWFSGITFFDRARDLGYECHIAWPDSWNRTTKVYCECFGDAKIHSLEKIKTSCGVHSYRKEPLKYDKEKEQSAFETIKKCVEDVCSIDHDVFLWIHLPHVWAGYTGYGSDIEMFDCFVGYLRTKFDDNCIFISADHGNMNGQHGKLGYAFDVYESATSIPLITPRIGDNKIIDFPTCNIDLFELIFEHRIIKREHIYSDTAYYAQVHRKLAVIHNEYKYIYTFHTKTEELYDVLYDPYEQMNLMNEKVYDPDRGTFCLANELYYYPKWDRLDSEKEYMREALYSVVRTPTLMEKIQGRYEYYGKKIKRKINYIKNKRKC